ncbi:putative cop number controling protein (plasmid) [Candidatus Phytoplasma asteris]|uniref:Cop number controling protein n=1 Tax=Candidatus Phytoplasma asteris TaxID=85620 RepID=A0ABZ2YFY7_9MOLU
MNKKRKIILKIWFIFIAIILLILLFLLGLKLPKLLKSKQQQDNNKVETQYKYQTQYIHDTDKVENIIGLMNYFKRLKELKKQQQESKQQQKQLESKKVVNRDLSTEEDRNILFHELSKKLDKIPQMKSISRLPEINHFSDETKQTESKYVVPEFKDENQKLKDIAVVTLTTGAVVITCSVLTPILSSVAPIGTIASKLVSIA